MIAAARKRCLCVCVPKCYGQEAIMRLKALRLNADGLKAKRDAEFVYIPLARKPTTDEWVSLQASIPQIQPLTQDFEERRRKTLAEELSGTIPQNLIAKLPRAFDVIGDIAIVEVPPELEAYSKLLGSAMLKLHSRIQTVLAKRGPVAGTFRLRQLVLLAGEPKTDTFYKENGCMYHVDVVRAYFSPRLSGEHRRVASLVGKHETVVDMFAGVGPFAILIAKTAENAMVYAVELNPAAFELLKENVRLNRVEKRVFPVFGDASQVADVLRGKADRVIMNLPERSVEFVESACKVLKPTGGVIHYYSFARQPASVENVKTQFLNALGKHGRRCQGFLEARRVRETAPYEWQVVLDAKVS